MCRWPSILDREVLKIISCFCLGVSVWTLIRPSFCDIKENSDDFSHIFLNSKVSQHLDKMTANKNTFPGGTNIDAKLCLRWNVDVSDADCLLVMMMKMQANAKVHMGEMSEPPAPALSEHKMRRMIPTIVWIYYLTIMVILLMRRSPNVTIVTIIFHKSDDLLSWKSCTTIDLIAVFNFSVIWF